MNIIEQRLAIAEVCGWVNARHKNKNYPTWKHRDGRRCTFVQLPNYLNDLNAMHEAEKCLTATQAAEYDSTLWITMRQEWNQTGIPKLAAAWHATAAQRAEAFLKTLNLWTP